MVHRRSARIDRLMIVERQELELDGVVQEVAACLEQLDEVVEVSPGVFGFEVDRLGADAFLEQRAVLGQLAEDREVLGDQGRGKLCLLFGVWSAAATGAAGFRRRERGRLRPDEAWLRRDGQEVGLLGGLELRGAFDLVHAQLLAHQGRVFFGLFDLNAVLRVLLRESVLVFHSRDGRVAAVRRARPSAARQAQQVPRGLVFPQVVRGAEAGPDRDFSDEQGEGDGESVAADGLFEALFLGLVDGSGPSSCLGRDCSRARSLWTW